MEIEKIYPEYYRTPRAPDAGVRQRGSPAFKGSIFNSSPQGQNELQKSLSGRQSRPSGFSSTPASLDPGVKTDVFETRRAVDKISQLDKKVAANPFTANISIPPMQADRPPSPVINFLKSPEGKAAMAVGGIIPMVRRDQSAIDKYEQGNNIGAGVVVAMGLANLPGDITQLGLGIRDGKEAFKAMLNGTFHKIPKKEYARACYFFRGTVLEKIMDPLLTKYNWLQALDKPIISSKFGERVLDAFKIGVKDTGFVAGITKNAAEITTVKFEGNSAQKVIGGSLLRLSPLALLTSVAVEVPALVKSVTETEGGFIDKAEAFGKQLIKSAAFVGFINAGIAVGAAAFALTPFGAAAELLGLAIGAFGGLMAARAANKGIDNIFAKEPVA